MKKQIILLFLIYLHCFSYSQQTYWQQELHYVIDVSLKDTDHELDGFLKLQYINHSPDTLSFIWFHLWPNAYKNDKSAFSEQQLENGQTDFYFSTKEQRGYINRLDFRINNATLKVEDHPQYIDIVKVWLVKPLAPGEQTTINTPFHVKLPHTFSRSGHAGQSYLVTQWYPKPAVYDKDGWHPMPYLDQGEFYSEFGSYDVRITLPKNYVVAATGELQNEEEKIWLTHKAAGKISIEMMKPEILSQKKGNKTILKKIVTMPPVSDKENKTLQYKQDHIHDFAWFADKQFIVNYDTIQLESGKIINAYSFYDSTDIKWWKNSISMIKDAVRFRSYLIGEYPYHVISVVEAKMGISGGMEYPTIACITHMPDEKSLDEVIEHEVGHNWFYGILANNEREHPWMDEGVNTYYDKRYMKWKYPQKSQQNWISKKLPEDFEILLVNTLAKIKKDQPIATTSVDFTWYNYGLVSYFKAAFWLQEIEKYIGRERFDSCMKTYFHEWKFRHPQPEDFLNILQTCGGKDLSAFRNALQEKVKIVPIERGRKKIKPAFLFDLRNTNRVTYINFLPAIGTNKYDGLMLGMVVHNFNLPPSNFRFMVAPLYATGSKQLNAVGVAAYYWYPDNRIQKIALGLNGSRFSSLKGIDSNGANLFGGFQKIVPFLRITFKNRSLRSSQEKWIEWRTFLIGEKGFDYVRKASDSLFYPSSGALRSRYLNQLTYNITDYRALYPYDVQFQLQQGGDFYRASATGNYFFNYAMGGGATVRFFTGFFGYLGGKTTRKEFETFPYQLKLTAIRGNEDYTYGNYFIGRNEIDGLASQQIMMRDGGLKIRTDVFQGLQGRSDNWIAALNFNTSIPHTIIPKIIPLKIFLDVGSYAEAWKNNAPTKRFLFVGGLQLSLMKELVNIYAPMVYSSEFRNNLKTVPEENKFFKKISFSFDIQRFNLRRLSGNKIPF